MRRSASAGLVGMMLTAALLVLAAPVAAQYADLDRADWKEDTPTPPPAYSLGGLIDIEMPRSSNVRMGIDPDTIRVNAQTGVVRYVVVARGPSAVNATYEGIRCATGEYRVYARQVQGSPWTDAGDSEWKTMRAQSGVLVQHPFQLARGGMCMGATVRTAVPEIVRELRTGNKALYY